MSQWKYLLVELNVVLTRIATALEAIAWPPRYLDQLGADPIDDCEIGEYCGRCRDD